MGVKIDQSACIGCSQCMEICPGNVIRMNEDGKAYLKQPSDCWSCVSCMKECQVGAIFLSLPPELEGSGSKMSIQRSGKSTEWTILRRDGTSVVLITNTDEANKY